MKKFVDELNIAVITTKYILEKASRYCSLAIDEITNLDVLVVGVADRPYGKDAFRVDIDSPWIVNS